QTNHKYLYKFLLQYHLQFSLHMETIIFQAPEVSNNRTSLQQLQFLIYWFQLHGFPLAVLSQLRVQQGGRLVLRSFPHSLKIRVESDLIELQKLYNKLAL
ncbi:hypothetical protein ACJX0J_027644, partial [Zea mays]